MAHDVFISYAKDDKAIADAVCAKLEANGIRCWIAPRDVPPGSSWAGAILDAISGIPVMVLIFSSNANISQHIKKEVLLAVNQGAGIIPFRIEDVLPEGDLKFHLEGIHWLDALTPPVEQHLEKLSDAVEANLQLFVYPHMGKEHKGVEDRNAYNSLHDTVDIDPTNPEAYLNRGNSYFLKGAYNLAIEDYTKAIEINQDYDYAYNNRGGTYYEIGEYEKAIEDYTKAIQINPNLLAAYCGRGLVYKNGVRDYDRAIAEYNKAIEIDPNYADAYIGCGDVYNRMAEYDSAVANYDKFIELKPYNPKGYSKRGNSFIGKGDYDAAIDNFTRAIELDPNYASAYYDRALSWFAKKEYEKAWADVEHCQRLGYYTDPELIKALRRELRGSL